MGDTYLSYMRPELCPAMSIRPAMHSARISMY